MRGRFKCLRYVLRRDKTESERLVNGMYVEKNGRSKKK